jgi:hypothetical protein
VSEEAIFFLVRIASSLSYPMRMGRKAGRFDDEPRSFAAKAQPASRRPSAVVFKHPSEPLPASDPALGDLAGPFDQLIPETLVTPLQVVMLAVLRDGSPEVPLPQRDDLGLAFRLDGSHESLSEDVQITTLCREFDRPIVIVNEAARSGQEPIECIGQIAGRLSHPG